MLIRKCILFLIKNVDFILISFHSTMYVIACINLKSISLITLAAKRQNETRGNTSTSIMKITYKTLKTRQQRILCSMHFIWKLSF